jgi:uncharacterized protein
VVGPSVVAIDGKEHELDVVVARDEGASVPADRLITAIGEAKAGTTLGRGHLRHLERARAALGVRAARARLLLIGAAFHEALREEAADRSDVELVDLERMYHGA